MDRPPCYGKFNWWLYDLHRARSLSNDRFYNRGQLIQAGWKAIALAVPLSLAVACGQSDEGSRSMGVKQTYSLCPNTGGARQRLYEQVSNFADQQQAQFSDRGAGVKRELSSLGPEVLTNTGGCPVLLGCEP
jgi:hypothetical protein